MPSRYSLTDIVNFKGQMTYGLYKPQPWIVNASLENIGSFTVTNDLEGRPDAISDLLYGTPNYYWVLVVLNRPLNPLNWPKAGQVIKVLSNEIIKANI